MQPKLFKTTLAEFVQAEYDGTNPSGWAPIGDKLIVKPDEVASKTRGGVELPDDLRDRMTMAAEAGVVVAIGEGAFKYDSNNLTPYMGYRPQPGDRVAMGRYSGQMIMGHDNLRYRIMSSSEIGAIEAKEDTNVH